MDFIEKNKELNNLYKNYNNDDETYEKILKINDISNSSTIESRINNIKNK